MAFIWLLCFGELLKFCGIGMELEISVWDVVTCIDSVDAEWKGEIVLFGHLLLKVIGTLQKPDLKILVCYLLIRCAF